MPASDRGSLPTPLTRFFGREAEAADLTALCTRERLVTLVGAPGCGKTRLAVEVAARQACVRFVDLSPITDPAHLGGATAAHLGVREEPGRSAEGSVVAALQAAAPVLLVVDNCEQIVDAAAGFVDRLLAQPGVRVLATSRVPLGLPGERVWPVPALDVDAAVELFRDRAVLASGADRPGRDRDVVEQVCTRLDRLPLAIELAAAWVRVLSPRQIADRLAEALPLLTGGTRGRSPRHETMLATVEWSYHRLPPAAQRMFEAVSVFVGGFDLAAVAAVADVGHDDHDLTGDHDPTGDGNVLPTLTTLVDHSLVLATPDDGHDHDAPRRYRLLEPVRQCAAALLVESGRADAVRRRHAEHHLDRAARFDYWAFGDRATDPTLAQLLRDEGNLLAALHWARDHAPDLLVRMSEAFGVLWDYGERVEEGRAWLQAVLATPDLDPALQTLALFWDGRLAWRQGDLVTARRRLDHPAVTATPDDEPWVGPYLLGVRASLALSSGDTAAALDLCQRGAADARAAGIAPILAGILITRGWALYVDGDVAAGDEQLHAALAADAETPTHSATLLAQAHFGLQYGALLAGEPDRQRRHLAAARAAVDDGGLLDRADWLGHGAALAATEGRVHAALRLAGGVTAHRRRGGTPGAAPVAGPVRRLAARTRRQVSPGVAERRHDEGAAMSWGELADLALSTRPDDRSPLSAREAEVTELVAEGLTNGEIAAKLSISRRTVESHLDHVRQKLGLRNRHQVMRWALQESPPEPG